MRDTEATIINRNKEGYRSQPLRNALCGRLTSCCSDRVPANVRKKCREDNSVTQAALAALPCYGVPEWRTIRFLAFHLFAPVDRGVHVLFLSNDTWEDMSSVPTGKDIHPFLRGNFAPVTQEFISHPCELVEGKIPVELLGGQYIRNGGNPIYPPEKGRHYHWSVTRQVFFDEMRLEANYV